MSSKVFPLLKMQDTANNINSQYGINEAVQLTLANGNTQFAIDLARRFQNSSYSIPTIALQLVARFYHRRCYINFDRFVVIVACFNLACKLRYMDFHLKQIICDFWSVMNARNQFLQPYSEPIFQRIRQEVCIAQSQILRTLQYEVEVVTPHDYLLQIYNLSQVDPQKLNKIKLTTRTIILDSNRLQTSLYFSLLVIAISSFLIACRYQGQKPYCIKSSANRQTASSQRSQKTDQQMYAQWLENISKAQKQKITQQDILECVKYLNRLIKLIAEQ